MHIVRHSSFVAVPWKNGGGVTHEAIRVPPGGEPFHWRVSVAQIDVSGPFSDFAAYNRFMVLLKGAGVVLKFSGGPGAAAPQSVILSGGAQAKNVFWQVGAAATINAGGGGTMVGTIIAKTGITFSTAASVDVVTLNGRALSLGASITLVDTVINVPPQ